MRILFTNISTTIYNQVNIRAERTEASWRERPNFEMVAKGSPTRALSIAGPAFYRCRAPLRTKISLEMVQSCTTGNQFGVLHHSFKRYCFLFGERGCMVGSTLISKKNVNQTQLADCRSIYQVNCMGENLVRTLPNTTWLEY